jgi:thiamine monophosphate synthase
VVSTPAGIVVLTDGRAARRPLVDTVAAAVDGGARWVVLREHTMGYADRRALADALRALLPPGHLIVSGTDPLGGTAIHLPAAAPLPPVVPFPTGSWLVGRSCHDRGELGGLSTEDYVTLSPIHPTATKPGYGPPLGAAGAAALRSPLPWLALGGIDSAEKAAECAAAGAAGVAVLGAVMRADDPAMVVRELVSGFTG